MYWDILELGASTKQIEGNSISHLAKPHLFAFGYLLCNYMHAVDIQSRVGLALVCSIYYGLYILHELIDPYVDLPLFKLILLFTRTYGPLNFYLYKP